jgi:hypothetical protein
VNVIRHFLAALLLAISSSVAAPRVAVMDFITDENSLRAQSVATNFTAMAQAELTQKFELVERAELAKAEQELKLSAGGRLGAGSSLRIGKLARADIVLHGFFFADGAERKFQAQAIDTGNANILAERAYALGISTNNGLSSAGTRLSEIAVELGALLREAIVEKEARARKMSFLFLPTGLSVPQADKLNTWPSFLETKMAGDPNRCAVRFPDAQSALRESSLALAGLIADPQSATKVADYYVWGQAATFGLQRFVFSFKVWNGRTEPVTLIITNNSVDATLDGLAAAIFAIAKIKPTGDGNEAIRRQVAQELTARAREMSRSANLLFLRDEAERLRFQRILRLYELAGFLDPTDPFPQALALQLKFCVPSIEGLEYPIACAASDAWAEFVDRFGFPAGMPVFTNALRRTEVSTMAGMYLNWPGRVTWALSQPGLEMGVPKDIGLTLRAELTSQWMDEIIRRLPKVKPTPDVVAAFQKHCSRAGRDFRAALPSKEMMPRRLRLLEAAEPIILELEKSDPSAAAGLRKETQAIKVALGNSPAPVAQPQVATGPPIRRAALPRFADEQKRLSQDGFFSQAGVFTKRTDDSRRRESYPLSWPVLEFLNPSATVVTNIAIPEQLRISEILGLAASGEEIFIAADQKVSARIEGESAGVTRLLPGATRASMELLTVRAKALVPAFPSLAPLGIQAMAPAGDEILIVSGNRIGSVKNGVVSFLPPIDGLDKPIWAAAAATGALFLLREGNTDVRQNGELVIVDLKENTLKASPRDDQSVPLVYGGRGSVAVAATDSYVAISRGPAEVLDMATGHWSLPPINQLETNRIPHREWIRIAAVAADHNGQFWFAVQDGLRRLDPKTGAIRFWRSQPSGTTARWSNSEMNELMDWAAKRERARRAGQPDPGVIETRLTGTIVNVIEDDKFLWIFTGAGRAILFDPASEMILGSVYLPMPATFAALTKNTLWIASGGFPATLACLDTRELKQTPRNKWQPIRVTSAEIQAVIERLPVTEKATFHWLAGNTSKVKELLGSLAALPDDKVDPVHLFLMSRNSESREFSNRLVHFSGALGELARNETNVGKASTARPQQPAATRSGLPPGMRTNFPSNRPRIAP